MMGMWFREYEIGVIEVTSFKQLESWSIAFMRRTRQIPSGVIIALGDDNNFHINANSKEEDVYEDIDEYIEFVNQTCHTTIEWKRA